MKQEQADSDSSPFKYLTDKKRLPGMLGRRFLELLFILLFVV